MKARHLAAVMAALALVGCASSSGGSSSGGSSSGGSSSGGSSSGGSSASPSPPSGFSYCSASATYAGPGTACAFADSVNNAWISQVGGGGTDKFPVRLTTVDGTAVTCTGDNVTATCRGPHGEAVWFQQ